MVNTIELDFRGLVRPANVTVCSAVHRPNYSLHVHMSQNFTELGVYLMYSVSTGFRYYNSEVRYHAPPTPQPGLLYTVHDIGMANGRA